MYAPDFNISDIPSKNAISETLQNIASDKKLKQSTYDQNFERLAADIYGLLLARAEKRSIFLVCEKSPATLDKGLHYYSLYYVNATGNICLFWPASEGGGCYLRHEGTEQGPQFA